MKNMISFGPSYLSFKNEIIKVKDEEASHWWKWKWWWCHVFVGKRWRKKPKFRKRKILVEILWPKRQREMLLV